MRLKIFYFYVSVIFTLGLWVLGGCNTPAESEAVSAPSTEKDDVQRNVVTHTVMSRSFTKQEEIISNILPNRQLAIIPSVPGTLIQTHVKEGDTVDEGQLLLEISPKDYQLYVDQAKSGKNTAQAAQDLAKVNLEMVKPQYKRFKKLYEEGAIPKAEFEKVEAGYKLATAQYKLSKTQVEQGLVGMKQAKAKLKETKVTAPFKATVMKQLLEKGGYVNAMPPTPVYLLMDIETVKVEGPISELLISQVSKKNKVEVLVDAYPNRTFPASIENISEMVDPKSRTLTIRAILDNPGHDLKVGMATRIIFYLTPSEQLALPRSAFIELSQKRGDVWVIQEGTPTTVTRKTVFVSGRDGKWLGVTEGISKGDKVVIDGFHHLEEGAAVDVVRSDS